MRIGVVREIKDRENRVALTPEGCRQLVAAGHEVVVEHDAGAGCGFGDDLYLQAGASIDTASAAWDSGLVLKIKEPMPQEYAYLSQNILFTYLHLAGVDAGLTQALLAGATTAVAYETVTDAAGGLPLLAPMSAIAGNMAASVGAWYLAQFNGGKGVQLGRILGQRNGKVLVIGAGNVGLHAAQSAAGLGATVQVCGRGKRDRERVLQLDSDAISFAESSPDRIAEYIRDSDLVVGAVLRAGERAPHVVTEAMIRSMSPGSVVVDVSIDQGGCIETSRPTSHSEPVFRVHDVVHYCVTNMPGTYARTATQALTTSTLPYVMKIADQALAALRQDPGLASGVNTHNGNITCEAVAIALNRGEDYRPFASD
jgi:alanine dehydrogenase